MRTAEVLVAVSELLPIIMAELTTNVLFVICAHTVALVLVTENTADLAMLCAEAVPTVAITATIKMKDTSFFIRCLWCGLVKLSSVKCYSERESSISFSLLPGSVIGMAAVLDGCNQYDCRF